MDSAKMVAAVIKAMGIALQPRDDKIKALEARIARLERTSAGESTKSLSAKPHWVFRGEWRSDAMYSLNDCVVNNGKMFVAQANQLAADLDHPLWQPR
jgi:hypothetical protein